VRKQVDKYFIHHHIGADMKKLLAIVSMLLFTLLAVAQTSPSTTAIQNSTATDVTSCTGMVYGGIFPTVTEPTTIICHKRYVIGFSTARHTPLWVAELLTADEVAHENVTRVNAFRPDPAVPSNVQGSAKAYAGTGYDKGHMNNFEDVADDAVAGSESFFMTNMVPQVAANNRTIWKSLEGHVRKLATQKGSVFVVTGPIFDGTIVTLKDGTPIPTRLYKMVISPSTKEAWTVVMPNTALSASTLPLYFSTIHNLQVTDPIVNVLPVPTQLTDQRSF
jgi:endonuclease G